MRSFEELEAAVLHVRDVPAHELEFEHVAVIGVAEQHRLATQVDAALARLEHAVGDEDRLCLFVEHRHVLRQRAGTTHAVQVLAVLPRALRHQRVGGVEHGLRRTIVFLERDDARGRREALRELQDVLDRGGTERIDRLCVVADHGESGAVGLQPQQDLGLHDVGVLVFVDQHVVETRADFGGQRRIGRHHVPVEQQVVVVEHLLFELGLDVGAAERGELLFPVQAPRVRRLQRVPQRSLRVDAMRVEP